MTYTSAVRKFHKRLMEDSALREALAEEFVAIGATYFGKHYAKPDVDPDLLEEIPVLTKEQFIKKKAEETGDTEKEVAADLERSDEAAFDDAYRHAVIVDLSDPEKPKLLAKERTEYGKDYIFSWKGVEEFADAHPKGDRVALHGDTVNGVQLFFPLPAARGGGRRPRSLRRKVVRQSTRTRRAR